MAPPHPTPSPAGSPDTGGPASALPPSVGPRRGHARPGARRRWALGAVSLGGAPGLPIPAHSIDAGQVGLDLVAQVDTAELQADVLTATGSATLSAPLGLQGLEPAFRIGLGAGHAIGVAPWELCWTYAFIDERREDVGFSLASSLELGLRSAGLGLWASQQRGTERAALRPMGGVWAGYSRDTVFFPISDGQRASAQGAAGGAFVDPDGGDAAAGLTAVARLVRVQIPVGVDLSARVGERAAITLSAGGGWSAPLQTELATRSCVDCLLGLEGYRSATGWTVFAGLRIEPWMTPARNAPAAAEVSP